MRCCWLPTGLRRRRAVYEDPAWFLGDVGHRGVVGANFTAQKSWTRQQVAEANPRWPDAEVDAKLAALRSWDPATVELPGRGGPRLHARQGFLAALDGWL